MNEQELTEMAMLKSQADTKNLERRNDAEKVQENVVPDAVNNSSKIEEPKEPKEPEIDVVTGEDIAKYKFKVKLGANKTVRFRNWTGKTKKEFKHMIENLSDVDSLDMDETMDILLRDYIYDSEMYFSETEQQYMILKIREVSLSDKVEYHSACPECNEIQKISSNIDKVYKYTESKFPKKNKQLDIEYIDIETQNLLDTQWENIKYSPNYDNITTKSDVEIAMHIKKENTSSLEILDMIDEMTLSDIEILMNGLHECASKMEMGVEEYCENPKCRKKVYFATDEIPDVFEELL